MHASESLTVRSIQGRLDGTFAACLLLQSCQAQRKGWSFLRAPTQLLRTRACTCNILVSQVPPVSRLRGSLHYIDIGLFLEGRKTCRRTRSTTYTCRQFISYSTSLRPVTLILSVQNHRVRPRGHRHHYSHGPVPCIDITPYSPNVWSYQRRHHAASSWNCLESFEMPSIT